MRIKELCGAVVLAGLVVQGFMSCAKRIPASEAKLQAFDHLCPSTGNCSNEEGSSCTIDVTSAPQPTYACVRLGGTATFTTTTTKLRQVQFVDGGTIGNISITSQQYAPSGLEIGPHTYCVSDEGTSCLDLQASGSTGEIEVIGGPLP